MEKEKYKMPSEKELKAIRRKLSRVRGSYILPPNASAVDRTKYELCKRVLLYMHRKGLSQRQLAKLMGVPETRVSEIVHYRISKFTLDRLVEYYERIEPKAALKVA